MITLTYQTNTITLPVDLQWVDQMAWQPVMQTVTRTLSGGMVVEPAAKLGGRPITLAPPDPNSAWTLGSTLSAMMAWAALPGAEFALNINGTSYTVIFRHQDGPIEASPVLFHNAMGDPDPWLATYRFMEV